MSESDDFTELDDLEFLAARRRIRDALDTTSTGEASPELAVSAAAMIEDLPRDAARMLAVEILLAGPESLGDDVLESCLYVLRTCPSVRADPCGFLARPRRWNTDQWRGVAAGAPRARTQRATPWVKEKTCLTTTARTSRPSPS
jgi:hypothetical protein